jgi:hypothetical protein
MKKSNIKEGHKAQVLSVNRQHAGKSGTISQTLPSNVEIEVDNSEEIIWVPLEHVVVMVQGRWRTIEDVERA